MAFYKLTQMVVLILSQRWIRNLIMKCCINWKIWNFILKRYCNLLRGRKIIIERQFGQSICVLHEAVIANRVMAECHILCHKNLLIRFLKVQKKLKILKQSKKLIGTTKLSFQTYFNHFLNFLPAFPRLSIDTDFKLTPVENFTWNSFA